MSDANEFVITREFNAPKNLLYKMWTEAEHLNNWWGPPGMKVEVVKMELKPGGTFLYAMKVPEGGLMYGKFVYREIITNEKIVFVVSFCDADGKAIRHPMAPSWPLETLSTLLFTESNGKTLLTMKGSAINASEDEVKTFVEGFSSMNQGWTGTLNQLETYLTSIK